ncbi:hypothetical protein GGS23DRAFT_586658 [Durotheca rogersii]|uniref:uncharacterized protein n=1 Tax=Durotheca rogersii TaxID=419775 RepID=UPI00221FEFA0|nr:uncharacterized protein GGS23DRAFT_586658 [Durotheca rogersii]KAI5858264.1 hypothetical protein GGS23DRAFT_586658 [Durotheca rogersii]
MLPRRWARRKPDARVGRDGSGDRECDGLRARRLAYLPIASFFLLLSPCFFYFYCSCYYFRYYYFCYYKFSFSFSFSFLYFNFTSSRLYL